MDIDETDEVLRSFLEQHWQRYATDTERQQYYLALRRPKAAAPHWAGSAFARRVEAEWARADEATCLGASEGAESIRKQAIERLFQEFRIVRGLTGRCSKCGGVLRTPVAKQCRWCHYDWHSA